MKMARLLGYLLHGFSIGDILSSRMTGVAEVMMRELPFVSIAVTKPSSQENVNLSCFKRKEFLQQRYLTCNDFNHHD